MLHGDVTYVDEALYENKLSVVFDDKDAARETLDRVREFIRNNPTVYCGTHTPQGYENLKACYEPRYPCSYRFGRGGLFREKGNR